MSDIIKDPVAYYISVESRLKDACSTYDTRYPAANRIAKCVEYLSEMHNARLANRSPGVPLNFRAIDGFSDISEIEQLLIGLEGEDPLVVKEKLKKLLKGSPFRHLEAQANQEARNTKFELMLLADLKRVQIDACLMPGNPDIMVKFDGKEIPIECKRILLAKTLRSNIKTASKQLKKSYANYKDANYGIIAVSVDRVITRGVNVYFKAKSLQAGMQGMQQELTSFVVENQRKVSNSTLDAQPKTVSILFHAGFSVEVEVDARPKVFYGTQFFSLIRPYGAENDNLCKSYRSDFSPLFSFRGYHTQKN